MDTRKTNGVHAVSWMELGVLFGVPTLLNYVACRITIPYLANLNIFPIEISYFLSVGLLVLAPMFFFAIIQAGRDVSSFKIKDILQRLRVHKIAGVDWVWTIAAFILLCLASFVISKDVMPKLGLNATPFFFQNMPLKAGYYGILYVWPFFFFFNIFGEEFLWRGYIQPRQELLTKQWTWLVHGLLWAVWHLPMGLDLIVAATPIFFILPAVVQLRKNTTIAIVVHAVFGAFGFLALAFGLVS
jgi:membrane protease YdiL (CAAX protease family)